MAGINPEIERPSLRGAKLRTQRAAEHLQELEKIIEQALRENPPDPVRITADKDALLNEGVARDLRFDWSRSRRPSRARLGIVAGEALYNLRAALDYLVFALAWLDSGQVQEHTQFPIADTGSAWRRDVASRLRGVSAQHRTALQRYQPFEGCEWTHSLRELSNPDKHRSLTAVYTQFEGPFRPDPHQATPVPGEPTRLRLPVAEQRIAVYFWNDAPVVETLESLGAEGATVLLEFQEEFGESDVLQIRDDGNQGGSR
jgi:hypothetical protein